MKTYTIADKEEAKKLIGRKVKVIEHDMYHSGCDKNGTLIGIYSDETSYEIDENNGGFCNGVRSFQLVSKTLDDIEVGDVLLSKNGTEIAVLARVNDLVAESEGGNLSEFFGWRTIDEIKWLGRTLKDSEPEEAQEGMQKEIIEKLIEVKNLFGRFEFTGRAEIEEIIKMVEAVKIVEKD